MLSFDVSAIDVVLLVVMLMLLLLFVKQRRGQSVAELRINTNDQIELLEEPRKIGETAEENSLDKQSAQGFQKCVHQFGHLRNMPKNTSIPDECFGCPKAIRCMFTNVQAQQVE